MKLKAHQPTPHITSSLFSYPCYSMATPGLYIDTNTLQVGIGTTRPQEAFHVQGNLLSTGNITSQGTVTASNLSILGDFVTLNTITSNTEQMVIQNAGTGPALKVTQTGANSIAEFYDDGNALALKIADGGNVGIGTTNPQVKLHVASDSFNVMSIQRINNAGGAQIELKNGTGYNVSTFIGSDSNMYFQSGAPGDNSKSFILAPSGNVGIGTIMPLAKLHVNGVIRNTIYEFRGIRNGSEQSGVHETEVYVQFDRTYDPYSLWNAATSGTYYTVPVTGTYSVSTNFLVYPFATMSYIYMYAKVTNSSDTYLYDAGRALTSLNVYTQISISTILNVSKNDRIRIISKQVSSAGANYTFIHGGWGDIAIHLLTAS